MLNSFTGNDVTPVRKAGVVEKCTFCYHRTTNGLQPACVEVCPSRARIFGDQDDGKSEIAQVLKANKSFRLKEEAGTQPNVHYIGKYATRA
jgi:Fe-S-cluster-containing dehydrogenase component